MVFFLLYRRLNREPSQILQREKDGSHKLLPYMSAPPLRTGNFVHLGPDFRKIL